MHRSLLGLLLAIAATSTGPGAALAQSRSATNTIQSEQGADLPRQRSQATKSVPKATATRIDRPADWATYRDDAVDLSALRFNDDPSRSSPNDSIQHLRDARPAAQIGGNLDGRGPSGYYGGTRLHAYHPDIRSGTHTNRNIVETRGHCNPARHQVLTAPRPVERPTPSRTASPPVTRPAPRTASPGD